MQIIGLHQQIGSEKIYAISGGFKGLINNDVYRYCWGIRPVVVMNDGVYIASGDGTESNPYVLGKD